MITHTKIKWITSTIICGLLWTLWYGKRDSLTSERKLALSNVEILTQIAEISDGELLDLSNLLLDDHNITSHDLCENSNDTQVQSICNLMRADQETAAIKRLEYAMSALNDSTISGPDDHMTKRLVWLFVRNNVPASLHDHAEFLEEAQKWGSRK